MRIPASVLNSFVDHLATRLASGYLVIFGGDSPRPSTTAESIDAALVVVPLVPFQPAINGEAIAIDLPPTEIQRTGRATWAQLQTVFGELMADLSVDTDNADVVLQTTAFRQGQVCTISLVTLRLRPQ